MDGKHTPGPWRLSLPDETCVIAGIRDVAVTVGNYADDEDAAFMAADARLIAAAPELLEALKLLSSRINRATCSQAQVHALTVADAIIAKAVGSPDASEGDRT